MQINKIVISGGGTGGHVFPAIAIANEVKKRYPNAEILFVGATGKMEMEKVPQVGYKIIGLPIRGFQRRFTFSNFLLPFQLIYSLVKAFLVLVKFRPQVAVGVGGYASGPTVRIASFLHIPSIIQEQNSFPGKTNIILSKVVNKVCVAYEGLERFFPSEKIIHTGNPVRNEMVDITGKKEMAYQKFNLDPSKKTILVIGGSLGAKTLNQSVLGCIEKIKDENVQILWQCGKFYFKELEPQKEELKKKHIFVNEFIFEMDFAYAVADVIISRAGAISVSELSLVKKPTILVPSPNVSDDHQTKNAKALVDKNAVVLVTDKEAETILIDRAIEILKDENISKNLVENISVVGISNASERIVNELEKLITL
jgi:UDP-N-acetylglucosamine--N-acetylmuramyl-(pentapeptide) pyrophosphoryl-undecaprenol N-acetylglucosamine transferase